MDSEDLYTVVVPTNGVTLSLLAGALVASSTPSSYTIPRIPCAEIQAKVSVVGSRRENKNSGSPVSRPSPKRYRILEASASTRPRARSKPRSESRSRSKFRSRRKKTSCSPISREPRPDSKSPKRERSCSVTSTCSKYRGNSSPNGRSPPNRPLSKDRRRRVTEFTRTPLDSPNRTSSRNYETEVPTLNESDVQKADRLVKSTTELAILPEENPKITSYVATAEYNFNRTLSQNRYADITIDGRSINDRNQAQDAKMRCDKSKEDCEEACSKKLLPADAVVNYMTGWLNCVEKIKSFYSDPVDCTGFEACPSLRERMAHHRLKHHTCRGFVPHVTTKRYAFEDSEPRWAENLQRTSRTEIPTREAIDQPVQTKLTLGDLGEIVIKLDKSIKISEENNKDPKKRRRSTLLGNDYAINNNRRDIDMDVKKHRISRLESDHTIHGNSQNYDQKIYGMDKNDFNNERRKMSQIKKSYSRSRQNSNSKRRSPSNDKDSYSRYSGDKTMYNDRRQQTYDDSSKIKKDYIRDQDTPDMKNYRKYSIKPNDNNKYDPKDRTNIENDDIINQERLDTNSYRKYSSKLNDNKEYLSRDRTNVGNNDIRNQESLNSERKYSTKSIDYKEHDSKYRKKIEQALRKSQNDNKENGYKNRQTQNDRNIMIGNNYAFNERNPDTATSSKFQGSNVANDPSMPLNKFENNNRELDNNIPLVNNPTNNFTAPFSDKNELNEAVRDWLKNVPLFSNISEKETITNELLEKINDLLHAPIEWEECDKILERLVNEHLDKLHAWYPGDKRDQDDFKRNLIQSFVQKIKPIFIQNTNGGNDQLKPENQMDDSIGNKNANSKRRNSERRSSRSKKKHKRVYKRGRGDHLIRCTISSNVLCGDTKAKKRKPSEKYKSEFAQEICNWLARYNFLKHDGLQQISMHDLVGILLNRLSPYLDRPYNSTNKLILKAKIVDIINSLPICIHHSPQQKTQVIKFADELANLLLNIQTRFDDNDSNDDDDDHDDSNKYHRPVVHRSEFMYIAKAVENCKNYYLRTQISEQLRKCLQNTVLSNQLSMQNQLTEVVLNYFELLQSGQKDVAKNAVMKALEESNVVIKDKITVANIIIGSLTSLSAKEAVEDMTETNLPSKLPVCLSEMEICDTVFAVSTKRSRKEPGLNAEEYEYFELVANVIRDWAETLPQSFTKLRKKQKEEFMYELAKDMLIQNRIEKIRPIPDTERDKFWVFFAYRWFYRLNLFEDLNDAEPYGSALCNKMNEALQARIVIQTGPSEEANEMLNNIHKNVDVTETDSSSGNSKNSRKIKAQERAEERERRKREKEELKKIKSQAREEAKHRKRKEKEEAKQKRLKEKEEAKQKRLKEKEEAKQKRLREREMRKGKSSSQSGDESENSESTEKDEKTQESATDEQCTKNCKKMNTVQLDDELPIAPNLSDNHKWKCATLSFQCLQKNNEPKPATTSSSNDPLAHLPVTSLPLSRPQPEKKRTPKMRPTAILPPRPPEVGSSINNSCPPDTTPTLQPQPKANWKEKHDLAQHCPCPRHHKHSQKRRTAEFQNVAASERYDQTQISCQKYAKLVQTSSFHIMPQIQDEKALTNNEKSDDNRTNAKSITKAQERYNQIYQVEDLYGQRRPSFSNTAVKNQHKFASSLKNIMQLYRDAIMKEYIKKYYLEYRYVKDDPLIRATFFHLLKSELQKSTAFFQQTKLTRHLLTPEDLQEELKYIKLISDWLKEMPLEKYFNTVMNKDRIYFVNELAQNIAQIQLDRIRAPNVMNYNIYLERVLKRYIIQLPLLPEQQNKILTMTDKLLSEINKIIFPPASSYTLLNDHSITEQNVAEFLDKHIRHNGEQLINDELVLDVWAHRLVEEVMNCIKECSVTHVLNFSVDSHIPDDAAIQFRLKLDYAKEIIELLNILPLSSTPIETKVKKIQELTEKLLFKDIKITKNPKNDRTDQELVKFIAKWMIDLPLNFDEEENVIGVVQDREDRINSFNQDCTQTECCSDRAFGTKLLADSTNMRYKEKDKRKSSVPECQIDNIIDKCSQCLPIEGPNKLGACLTQKNINEFVKNLKQSENTRKVLRSRSQKTYSRIFCDQNHSNFGGVHANMYRPDPSIPNCIHKRISKDDSSRSYFSTYTGLFCDNWNIPMSSQKFPMKVNPFHNESESKKSFTQYGIWQGQVDPRDQYNRHAIQDNYGRQPPLQQEQYPTMGYHVMRTNERSKAFEDHQVVKHQSENTSRGSRVEQTSTEQSFFGLCSCSISKFENCCGRTGDTLVQNTIEMVTEQTSTCGLDYIGHHQQSQSERQGCGIQQLTHGSHVNRFGQATDETTQSQDYGTAQNDSQKQYEVHGTTTQQDQEAAGQQTTSSQTVAVKIAEQGCAAQHIPHEALKDQLGQIPKDPTQSRKGPNIVQGSRAAKTMSQYGTSGSAFSHSHDGSKRSGPPSLRHSIPEQAPRSQICNLNQQQQPADLSQSKKPSYCNSILPPPESTPGDVSAQQSLLSEHLDQQRFPNGQSQKPGSKEYRFNQTPPKLQVEKCCSQNEPHQYRVLSIPEPECTRHGSDRPSYAYLGLSRRLMIGIPKQTRSLSPGHYQLISPTFQSGLQRQYLYTIKNGRSCYDQVNHHNKQNLSASVFRYYSQQQNVNGYSNIQAQFCQPAATSTETIACRSAEISTCDDGSKFADDFRVQSIHESRNHDQKLCNELDSGCNEGRKSYYSPCPNLDKDSIHMEDDRAVKKCYHIECKGYIDCAHIPVLQYCESVEEFLPTWLPQRWLALSRKKKK